MAIGLDGVLGCRTMTVTTITCKILFLIFEVIDITALLVTTSTLHTNSFIYYMPCPVPSPTSLLLKLVITEVSWSNLGSKPL